MKKYIEKKYNSFVLERRKFPFKNMKRYKNFIKNIDSICNKYENIYGINIMNEMSDNKLIININDKRKILEFDINLNDLPIYIKNIVMLKNNKVFYRGQDIFDHELNNYNEFIVEIRNFINDFFDI